VLRARPPLLFTVAYGAGLATGILRFGDPLIVLGITVAAAALIARPFATLLATAVILGSLSARIAWLHEAHSCASRLPSGRMQLLVRLVDPSDPLGGRVDVRPLGAGCRGTVAGRWPAGQNEMAGTVFQVTAKWLPRADVGARPSGTLVVARARRVATRPSLGERMRSSLTQASRSLYGARSPLVDALILGRRGGIDRTLQDRFAQSGLVHLLSISGFHVGVITAWVFLLCRVFRGSRARALAVAATVSVVYVAFLGWPAPATRAAALAVLVAISRIRQRRVETNALLSATCLCVLLVDPWAVVDLGGWLSVAALWGATTFTRWTDRALGPTVAWRTLGSSLGATLATAPITAGALGTVAPIGILLNFGAIPLAAITVPGVFASLLLFPLWPDLGNSLAGGAGLGLHLLEILATAGAAVPRGHVIAAAGIQSAAPWMAVLLLSLWAMGARNTLPEAVRRWSWSAVAAIWVALLWSSATASADSGSKLALHFLDVGQGDGAVLRTPAGRWVLIDAGPKTDRSDAGRRVVVPFLLRAGARGLSIVFVSHAHADHLGGVPSVLDRFPTQAVIEPGEPVADPMYYGFLDGLAAEAIPWYAGRLGQRFTLDSVSFTILHPDRRWSGWGEDVNEDSLVLLIQYREFEVLFAGDVGFPAEREMRTRIRPVDLLKVGHHGSRGSSGDEWLDSLRPQVAVISVGQNNYGHPAPETLGRLRRHRVEVWRTDQHGSTTVTTDGRMMTIRARDRERTYDVRERVNSQQ
jgi:competence protein ComEC